MHLEVVISEDRSEVVISGDTFLIKDKIKSLGKARWDPLGKRWIVSGSNFNSDLIQGLFPGASVRSSKSTGSDAGLQENIIEKNLIEKKASSRKIVSRSSARDVGSDVPGDEQAVAYGAASVQELVGLVSGVLSQAFPGEVKVFGSISSFKKLSNGRCYFDLLDIENGDTSLPCVLWEYDAKGIDRILSEAGFLLENDLPVLLKGQIRLNPKKAQISFRITGLVPEFTLGKLQAEREKTNNRLKKENLFLRNKEKKLPLLPVTLGIMTSKAGTVINDFLASLRVCGFGFNIIWYPVRVQGLDATREVCAGIEYFNKKKEVDCILIFRGGGSASELGLFNSYDIARKICLSDKPVLSAIGHEYDQTSTQDVSFFAGGVPKDLGRFFSDLIIERKRTLLENMLLLKNTGNECVQNAQNNFVQRAQKVASSGERLFQSKRLKTELLCSSILERSYPVVQIAENNLMRFLQLSPVAQSRIDSYSEKLSFHDKLLQVVAPETQLKRGFSLLKSKEGKLMTSLEGLKEGTDYSLFMKDGEARVKVTELLKGEYGKKTNI